MAFSAKKKSRAREKERIATLMEASKNTPEKRCTCLVSIRGRGQHAIDCALFGG